MTVTRDDGTEEKVAAKNILIATGSEVTPFPGIEVRSSLSFNTDGRESRNLKWVECKKGS